MSDYGHGLITEKIAKLISQKKIFFSLNAQVNAANLGFHSLSKYRNIDALIINESELRHEMRDKNSDIDKLSLFGKDECIAGLLQRISPTKRAFDHQ